MDGWLDLIGGVAGVVAVALAASWLAAGGSNALGGLVAGWREPDWPRGVQEDDDVHWAWPAVGRGEEPGRAAPNPRPLHARVDWRGR